MVAHGDALHGAKREARHLTSGSYVQDMDTDIYEAHHKVMKAAGRETNTKNATFERDQTKCMSFSQSIVQLAAARPAFGALVNGEIKTAQIKEDGPAPGVYMKIPAHNRPQGEDTTSQPITLDRVSATQRSVEGKYPHTRMSYMVCSVHASEKTECFAFATR